MSIIPGESIPVYPQIRFNAIFIAVVAIIDGAIIATISGKIAYIYGLPAISIMGLIAMMELVPVI